MFGENVNIIHELDYFARKVFDATEEYVIFIADGADGDRYVMILDKDGNRVVEPFESGSTQNAYIIGDYAVVEDKIINCKTGEIKTVDYEEISGYTGKMLVQSDGAYYLADISNPETLINPFEIAE